VVHLPPAATCNSVLLNCYHQSLVIIPHEKRGNTVQFFSLLSALLPPNYFSQVFRELLLLLKTHIITYGVSME
jgi:hypothetical protein